MSRQSGRGVTVDRKAMLMVKQLQKFKMSVTGISETKWFGSAVYDVDGYLIRTQGVLFQEMVRRLRGMRVLVLY